MTDAQMAGAELRTIMAKLFEGIASLYLDWKAGGMSRLEFFRAVEIYKHNYRKACEQAVNQAASRMVYSEHSEKAGEGTPPLD